MRAAAILGLGCSLKNLKPFQTDNSVKWRIGMPTSPDEADLVLLFGGDGTIHRHLGQLVKLGRPVLVVPAGSGNDFACSLGLRHVRDSLAAWRKFYADGGNVRAIDLGTITPRPNMNRAGFSVHGSEIPTSGNIGQKWGTQPASASEGTYFCCVVGVGLDGEVARRANQLPRWLRGNGGYLLGLLPSIFAFAPFPLKVLVPSDGELGNGWTIRSDQASLLAAFANTPLYGGGMKVAPQAKMDDGLLDVCLVGAVGRVKLFSLFPTVYAGKHLKIREVQYFHGTRFRVETERPLDVYADGEFVCRTPVEVGVQPAALSVITLSS
jgi:diacylglycerol kinase (ATP)